MSRLELPDPATVAAPPFRDAKAAQAWLKLQPQAEPTQMQAALQAAVAGLDASTIPPLERLEILEALRGAVILAQSALESRYARKALPLPAAEVEVFANSRRLWRTLAVAYLRTVPQLPPAESALPLHRGVVALRLEQYSHFLAAYEVPSQLLGLLYGALTHAEAAGVQRTPLVDPQYKHLGESHIAGHVAWAFLLQFSDPYRLSAAQLAVANRGFSRWRELAGFQSAPGDDPKARELPLTRILGEQGVLEGGPQWLDVRPVARKIRKRIEALETGESPEELKLGRELSSTACIRLLRQLDEALRPAVPPAGGESAAVSLTFGAENAYAVLAGRQLNPSTALDTSSRSLSHQRMAVFGFDNLAERADAVTKVEVRSETWQAASGFVRRAPDAGARLLAPCLVAMPGGAGQPARFGVLAGLRVAADGGLKALLQWYPAPVQAAWLKQTTGAKVVKVPVFVLGSGDELSLVLPANAAVRPASRLHLEDSAVALVILGQVLERGADFVRHAVEQE